MNEAAPIRAALIRAAPISEALLTLLAPALLCLCAGLDPVSGMCIMKV
jgi:hypothetical protein